MKGSLYFENNNNNRLDIEMININSSLERKINLLNDDMDKLYYLHYNFKASHKNAENLYNQIKKIKLDVSKYEDILKRYIKYQGARK